MEDRFVSRKVGLELLGLRLAALDSYILTDAAVGLSEGGFSFRGKLYKDRRVVVRAEGWGASLEAAVRDWAVTVYMKLGLAEDF